MTREDAIQFLDNMKHEEAGRAIGKDVFYVELMWYHVDALNMAIKALEQEQKTGEWIVYEDCEGKTRTCTCNLCGYETGEYTWENPNYCENCGAKMKPKGEGGGEA